MENHEIQIRAQGRLVIPAGLRKSMNLNAGDALLAHLEEDRLVLERRDSVVRRLKERVRHVPRGMSLADELIAQRRAEAVQESSAT